MPAPLVEATTCPVGFVAVMPRPGGYAPVRDLSIRLPRKALPGWDPWWLRAAAAPAPTADLVEHVKLHVEKDGWTAVGSAAARYAYTVGLTGFGWPELVISLERRSPDEASKVFGFAVTTLASTKGQGLEPGGERCLGALHVLVEAIMPETAARVCPVARELSNAAAVVRAVELTPLPHRPWHTSP